MMVEGMIDGRVGIVRIVVFVEGEEIGVGIREMGVMGEGDVEVGDKLGGW